MDLLKVFRDIDWRIVRVWRSGVRYGLAGYGLRILLENTRRCIPSR